MLACTLQYVTCYPVVRGRASEAAGGAEPPGTPHCIIKGVDEHDRGRCAFLQDHLQGQKRDRQAIARFSGVLL